LIYPFANLAHTRQFPTWALILVLIGIWLATQIAGMIGYGAALFLSTAMFVDGSSVEPSAVFMVAGIVMAIAFASIVMIALVLLWSCRQERRGFAELGIKFDRIGWRQYGNGLVIGFLFAFVLILVAALVQAALSFGKDEAEITNFILNRSKLADIRLWVLVIVLALLFAVQGAAEELLCRGWLLGALSAKKDLLYGLFLSSFLFASLHVHYFFIDGLSVSAQQILIGSVAIGAIFAMGLMLGMVSLRDRSIMGAAGLHSAFNFFIITFALIAFLISEEASSVFDAALDGFSESTSVEGVEPALVVQFITSIFIAAFLYWRFGLPKRKIPPL